MSHFIHALSTWVLHQFARQPYVILFSIVFVEEAGIPLPIPGDALVILAGAQAHKTVVYDMIILSISSLAVFLGSTVLYFVSRRSGLLLLRYGRLVRLSRSRIERVELWFRRHGKSAIIFGRLIPGVRIPTTIMAGLSNVPFRVFAPANAIAAVIWSLFYFFLGAAVQREWRLLTAVFSSLLDQLSDGVLVVWTVVISLGLLLGAWHVSRRVRKAHRRKREKDRFPLHPPTPAQPIA